jgi:hypothetical protein
MELSNAVAEPRQEVYSAGSASVSGAELSATCSAAPVVGATVGTELLSRVARLDGGTWTEVSPCTAAELAVVKQRIASKFTRRCSRARSGNSEVGLIELRASVTCAVGQDGAVCWWITRESGELPVCNHRQPCLGGQYLEGAGDVLSLEDRIKSYLTFVTVTEQSSFARLTGRSVMFAPLTAVAVDIVSGIVNSGVHPDTGSGQMSEGRRAALLRVVKCVDPRSQHLWSRRKGGAADCRIDEATLLRSGEEHTIAGMLRAGFVSLGSFHGLFSAGLGQRFWGSTDSLCPVEHSFQQMETWNSCPGVGRGYGK